MNKVYLAGPMTGIKDHNYPAFHAAAKLLRDRGFAVINPAEIVGGHGVKWVDAMKLDIRAMLLCDTVAMLPGWTESRGAIVEFNLAKTVEINVVELAELVECSVDNGGCYGTGNEREL